MRTYKEIVKNYILISSEILKRKRGGILSLNAKLFSEFSWY